MIAPSSLPETAAEKSNIPKMRVPHSLVAKGADDRTSCVAVEVTARTVSAGIEDNSGIAFHTKAAL